jgi:predicted DNA-binding transcriptional regulator AlpA
MKDINEKPVLDIPDFCEAHGISRALLHKMWRNGTGPRIMKIGRRTLISTEAAAEWRKGLEAKQTNKRGAK